MSRTLRPPAPSGPAPENTVEAGPLKLVADDTGDRLLIYQAKDGVRVDLRVEGETFWAAQAQMAQMFGVTQQAVSEHVRNIFAEGELSDSEATHKKFLLVRQEGNRQVRRAIDHYDLNVLIAVGYRVGGPMGTMFRIWATDKLFQYLSKGFVLDDRRLKNPDGATDHFNELLERIRDIRSSEKRMWLRILELASFCNDYDPKDHAQHAAFFAAIQNAMHYAVAQMTAAEIVFDRVDASMPNAGLTSFDGELPTVAEAKVAKNYLAEGEIKPLNHITSLALEFFESQAEQRRPTTLAQFLEKMRDLIRLDGRPLIGANDKGQRTKAEADDKASRQIKLYKERARRQRELEGEAALKGIAETVKAAARKPRGRRKGG